MSKLIAPIVGTETFKDFCSSHDVAFSDRNKRWLEERTEEYERVLQGTSAVITATYRLQKRDEEEKDAYEAEYIMYSFSPVFIYKGVMYTLYRDRQSNTYYMARWVGQRHPYLKNYAAREVLEEYKPNRFSKATDKKLEEWAQYLDRVERIEQDFIELTTNRISAFREKLEVYDKKGLVNWDNGYKERVAGSIVTNGLEFTFHIRPDGYIEQTVQKYYKVGNTLTAFEAAQKGEHII